MINWYLWLTNLWSSDIYDWLIYDHLISMIDWFMIIWYLWLTDLWWYYIFNWLIYDHLMPMMQHAVERQNLIFSCSRTWIGVLSFKFSLGLITIPTFINHFQKNLKHVFIFQEVVYFQPTYIGTSSSVTVFVRNPCRVPLRYDILSLMFLHRICIQKIWNITRSKDHNLLIKFVVKVFQLFISNSLICILLVIKFGFEFPVF